MAASNGLNGVRGMRFKGSFEGRLKFSTGVMAKGYSSDGQS